MPVTLRILVRGSNDIGSAVAHTLFCAGYAVVMHDVSQPTVTRRKMAFTDAVFDGRAALEGIEARRLDDLSLLDGYLEKHEFIPLLVVEFATVLAPLSPHILLDARMRKHQQPEAQLGLAPLTIGLGPNFVTGVTTDLAVETGRGDQLGRVITQGATRALQGEPQELGGHARDRYVYAPCQGIFRTRFQPGDAVLQGQEIARIDNLPLHAPLSGTLRGITYDGVPVSAGTKVIEVDPRLDAPQISGIAGRPAKIAASILEAVQDWEKRHAG